MKKLASLTGVAALAAALVTGFAFVTAPANALGPGKSSQEEFGLLEEPDTTDSWLIHHYDNRGADVTGGPGFDDSADVKFVGTISGIGKVTVEQSAAWTFNTYRHPGGTGATGPCAVIYDTPRTLVKIHKHQGVSTENVTGPLTLIDGSAVNNPGGTSEFPFSAAGTGADGLVVGTHIFTGTFTITVKGKKNSLNTIFGIVEGGTNCEVEVFTTVGGHDPTGVFDFDHDDTNNTVQTALEILDGTGDFDGATGTAALTFTYDTLEPHNLLGAHIVVLLD